MSYHTATDIIIRSTSEVLGHLIYYIKVNNQQQCLMTFMITAIRLILQCEEIFYRTQLLFHMRRYRYINTKCLIKYKMRESITNFAR